MLNLLSAVLQPYQDPLQTVDPKLYEMYFAYCMAWAIGGLFETEQREKFHKYLENRSAPMP